MSTWGIFNVDNCSLSYKFYVTWVIVFTHFGISHSEAFRYQQGECNIIWAATWQNQQSDCAPSEDSDQAGHPPSLISAFAVHMKKACVLSYPLSAQRRPWSDWADAQAESSMGAQSLCWFCHFAAQLFYVLKFSRVLTVNMCIRCV